VRQLENLCNWITVMAPGQTVEVKDLPQDLIEERSSNFQPTQTHTTSSAVPAEAHGSAGGSVGYDSDAGADRSWISLLETEAAQMLAEERPEVMDILGRQFEATLIKIALKHTHGRKNDAAVRLGIGRNTITRKIQELGIGGAEDD